MTAETSKARGLDVEARQAWYEQQIALAETQWADEFYDMWECGDDVPSKEHYVALWLAERAAPPPAAARGDVRIIARDIHYAIMDDGLAPLSNADNHKVREAILRVLQAALAALEAAREDACVALVADIRFACGDNGKRMQPELVEFIRGLAEDAARWRFCVERDTMPVIGNDGKTWCMFVAVTSRRRSLFTGRSPAEAVDAAIDQARGKGGGEVGS